MTNRKKALFTGSGSKAFFVLDNIRESYKPLKPFKRFKPSQNGGGIIVAHSVSGG